MGAPTNAELECLWAKCSAFPPTAMSSAISCHLAETANTHEWQSQQRALRILSFLFSKGEAGKSIVNGVMAQAGDLVHHLATHMPDCRDDAWLVILAWKRAE